MTISLVISAHTEQDKEQLMNWILEGECRGTVPDNLVTQLVPDNLTTKEDIIKWTGTYGPGLALKLQDTKAEEAKLYPQGPKYVWQDPYLT